MQSTKMQIKSILSVFTIAIIFICANAFTNTQPAQAQEVLSLGIKGKIQGREFLSIPANAVWITRMVVSADGKTANFYTGIASRQALNVPLFYSADKKTVFTKRFSMEGTDWTFSATMSGIQLVSKQAAYYTNGVEKFDVTLIRN